MHWRGSDGLSYELGGSGPAHPHAAAGRDTWWHLPSPLSCEMVGRATVAETKQCFQWVPWVPSEYLLGAAGGLPGASQGRLTFEMVFGEIRKL